MDSHPDNLVGLEVSRLFGRFNYNLSFSNKENLVIITAPNGYGKTIILRIMYHFFTKRMSFFSTIDFECITFQFNYNRSISISQIAGDLTEPVPELEFKATGFAETAKHWNMPAGGMMPTRLYERYLPVTHAGDDTWFDAISEQLLSSYEVFQFYKDRLPPKAFRDMEFPPWLETATTMVPCHLIETQRLLSIKQDETRTGLRERRRIHPSSVVDEDAQDLSKRIGNLLQQYASESQELDQTFPKRIIEKRRGQPDKEEVIRRELSDIAQRQEDLVSVGLMSKTSSVPVRPTDELTQSLIRHILSIYIADTKKKLSIFDDLYEKIHLFKEIIAEHFSFKNIIIDPQHGITATDSESQNKIPLSELSSGEQHELVLIYELIFKVNEGTLILIDEPELSLHVAWQKRFIDNIQKIQKLRKLKAIIATHSPQIIDDNWDLVQDLAEQNEYYS